MALYPTIGEAKLIRCQGIGLTNGFAEGPNKFTIVAGKNHDVTQLGIGFDSPSRPDVNIVAKKDNTVDVTYTVTTPGDYMIHIRYGEHYINGAPFKCKILGDLAGAVKQVNCKGATKIGLVGIKNEIYVDMRHVGIMGCVEAHMEGPGSPKLDCDHLKDGRIVYMYTPSEPGKYKLHLKYQQYHLPGSPFTLDVA